MRPRAGARRRLLLALLLLLPAGCALDDGGFLLELLPDTLLARLGARASRYTEDGWLQTSEGYTLRLDDLQLLPSGLTLLGGQDGAALPLVTLPLTTPVPVATRASAAALGGVPLGACTPGCGLEVTTLQAALLPIEGLRAEGMVADRGGRRLPGPTPFRVDLRLAEEVVLRRALHLPLDRRVPERLVLQALTEVAAELGDGVDWAALPREGGGRLCLASAPPCEMDQAAWRLRQNLTASSLVVDLSEPIE